MSPTVPRSAIAVTALTPGSVMSRRASASLSASAAMILSNAASSPSTKSICRRHAWTLRRSSSGSRSTRADSHARPLTPNRSLIGGRSMRLRCSAAWTWFFSRVRWRTSAQRREINRRRARAASSGVQTSSKNPTASSRASVLASTLSVLARRDFSCTALGLASTTRATSGSTIRAIASALAVASIATASLGARLRANSSSAGGVVKIRPATRTSPFSAIAISQKSRCTSIPMLRTITSLVVDAREAAGDNDNYGSVLSAHPDTRGGGQLQTAGSQPIETPACPTSALTEPPPGTTGDATPRPGRRAHRASSWPYNFSLAALWHRAIVERAKIVIVEESAALPRLDGIGNAVHESEVDYVIAGDDGPLPEIPNLPPTDTDRAVARLITAEVEDGSCLQIGIGAMPNAVCSLLRDSGVRELGVHTEMLTDGIVDLYRAGVVTGARKTLYPGKVVCTFGLGTAMQYETADRNPDFLCHSVDLTNQPYAVMQNERVVAINSTTQMDLQGQAASESAGHRHISGTGGRAQLGRGAYAWVGGKSFICMPSTLERPGGRASRIVVDLTSGNVVTCTRADMMYVVTEHGIVNLKGKSVPERARAMISVAHPDFRDELEREARGHGLIRRESF